MGCTQTLHAHVGAIPSGFVSQLGVHCVDLSECCRVAVPAGLASDHQCSYISLSEDLDVGDGLGRAELGVSRWLHCMNCVLQVTGDSAPGIRASLHWLRMRCMYASSLALILMPAHRDAPCA